MRTKIVASATAAGVLLLNVATTEGQLSALKGHEAQVAPVVLTDNCRPTQRPLLADNTTNMKRPMIVA